MRVSQGFRPGTLEGIGKKGWVWVVPLLRLTSVLTCLSLSKGVIGKTRGMTVRDDLIF